VWGVQWIMYWIIYALMETVEVFGGWILLWYASFVKAHLVTACKACCHNVSSIPLSGLCPREAVA
jgi:hypothetical protein